MPFDSSMDQGGNAALVIGGSGIQSRLMSIMELDAIDPGSDPSYQACKAIYVYHPLGARMVDTPLQMAMSQERKLSIPGAPEEDLLKAFRREWKRIGSIGADNIIYRAVQLSHIYGVATLACNVVKPNGEKENPADPLPLDDEFWKADLYFNIYDPLTTSGSLVLNQDPDAVDYMHPKQVTAGGSVWSNTKTLVLMHEQPIWLQWTNSAFGFVGRSVYQRAFYPLKSFLVSMIADQKIQEKEALIVYKASSPGSVLDMAARAFKAMQRLAIKFGVNGNVVSIGKDESLETLNLEHVATAGTYSRDNILKNIATAAGMPAQILNQETLAEGFGEGSEDAKQIARYVDRLRIEMNPAYEFMDKIVMRRAWNPEFYREVIQKRYPEQYAGLSYRAALHEWMDAWEPTWPNLLTEPDSEKAKAAQAKLDSAQKIAETLFKVADPENRAAVADWLTDIVNEQGEFYSSQLLFDSESMASYEPVSPSETAD